MAKFGCGVAEILSWEFPGNSWESAPDAICEFCAVHALCGCCGDDVCDDEAEANVCWCCVVVSPCCGEAEGENSFVWGGARPKFWLPSVAEPGETNVDNSK